MIDFRKHYDVVVAGAGPGGFGAAMGAAKTGKKVLLFDKNAAPGGVASFCGCPVFSGVHSFKDDSLCGAAQELAGALQASSMILNKQTLNSTEFHISLAMTQLLKQVGVEMLFYVSLSRVKRNGTRIESVTLCGCGKEYEFLADSFVDCTGDAFLADAAGASAVAGTPEETMTKTLVFKVTNFHDYDKMKLLEMFKELDFPYKHQDRFMGTLLGDGKEMMMNLTAVSGNALDPFEMTRMDMELREQVPVILDWMRKKLPGFEKCRLTGVAPVMGVRGGRNIRSRFFMTEDFIKSHAPVSEPVAVGKRSYGEHYVHTFYSPWVNKDHSALEIPYGALLSADVENLAAGGRCIGIEPKAVSAIRLMPVCMATGQAAGIAAAMGFPAYRVLEKELVRQKCRKTMMNEER